MSIRAGQVEVLNVGIGIDGDAKIAVTVVIAGGTCNVQIANEKDALKRRNR